MKLTIGLIREGKTPPDSRVPLTPLQCKQAQLNSNIEIVVEKSPNRCYSDDEYLAAGVKLVEDVSECDVLLGVKEVPINNLIPNKTYFFFSHTIKKQPYNQDMLISILDKGITLVDYEVLTADNGSRLIAFGRFAGMVGAHNGIMAYGRKSGLFDLFRMKDCLDYKAAKSKYDAINFPNLKIVLTGNGRVANGAAEVLVDMGFTKIDPSKFLDEKQEGGVFTQLSPSEYVEHSEGKDFVQADFFTNPKNYQSKFLPFTRFADLMINGIYWDNEAPAFFSLEEMRHPDFKISVIADVTCDIAPISSIPSTLFASTIENPVFGFDPITGSEKVPYQSDFIDMMTVDNLPNELPRDASEAFGQMFMDHIMPELMEDNSSILERATIAENGRLGKHFEYLSGYVDRVLNE
ncbi:MAG: NAD(P)-dependent oxidoreductase [Bacteroidota bacterium]